MIRADKRTFFLLLLTVVGAPPTLSVARVAPAREPVAFEAFIAPFAPDLQTRARAVWDTIEPSVLV